MVSSSSSKVQIIFFQRQLWPRPWHHHGSDISASYIISIWAAGNQLASSGVGSSVTNELFYVPESRRPVLSSWKPYLLCSKTAYDAVITVDSSIKTWWQSRSHAWWMISCFTSSQSPILLGILLFLGPFLASCCIRVRLDSRGFPTEQEARFTLKHHQSLLNIHFAKSFDHKWV